MLVFSLYYVLGNVLCILHAHMGAPLFMFDILFTNLPIKNIYTMKP